MSIETIREAARAEQPEGDDPAEPTEPDDGDKGDETGGEPQPPPEPSEQVDPARVEKEMKRHHKALRAILGPGMDDMAECRSCGGMGFLPAGVEPMPEPKPDPDVVRCEACNGYGDRLSPSLKEQYAAITCTVCQGTGYRQRREVDAERQAAEQMAVAPAYAAPLPPPPAPTWDAARGVFVDASGNVLTPAAPMANGASGVPTY